MLGSNLNQSKTQFQLELSLAQFGPSLLVDVLVVLSGCGGLWVRNTIRVDVVVQRNSPPPGEDNTTYLWWGTPWPHTGWSTPPPPCHLWCRQTLPHDRLHHCKERQQLAGQIFPGMKSMACREPCCPPATGWRRWWSAGGSQGWWPPPQSAPPCSWSESATTSGLGC